MRKNFKIILTALAALSLLILTFAIYSCCEDCPIGPVQSRPYKGWLYATNIQNNWVYKIDTEIDSLVDSINSGIDPSYTPGSIDVSQDGHYLAVPYYSIPLNDKFVRIYDAQSLEIIIDIADYFFPIFITGENILLAIRNGVHIYSLPDFTLLSSDSIGPSLFPVLYEKKHLVYILSMVGYTNTDSTFLYAYDYKQRKKVGQWFFSDSKDSLASIGPFDIHPDGERIYALGGSENDGATMACHDLQTGDLIFYNRLFTTNGGIKVSPDGKDVYVTDPGSSTSISSPGTVFIFDANDGNYVQGISLYGYDDSPIWPLCASPIAFTPIGNKAYIGSGRPNIRAGTIAVVDTRTRNIIKNIWPDLEHFIGVLKVGPKL